MITSNSFYKNKTQDYIHIKNGLNFILTNIIKCFNSTIFFL